MQKEKARELLAKYQQGLCTAEENAIVEAWFKKVQQGSDWEIPEQDATDIRLRMLSKIMEQTDEIVRPAGKIRFLNRYRWYAAASLLLLVSAMSFFWWTSFRNTKRSIIYSEAAKVLPGRTGAILTLSNGETVLLDSAGNGVIATQGGTSIVKDQDQIKYHPESGSKDIVYNTITTPTGRTFKVMLPDSSHVWLNAESSITYPTAFAGKDREVSITGEVYFEVTHKTGINFRVKAGSETFEDLGTSFNINAYTDEPNLKGTLVEGALKIRDVIMRPENQVMIARSGKMQLLENVDVENVVAWKNGNFHFNSVDIHTIMRQVGRWYGVNIEYEGTFEETYSGGISRNVKLAELLHILEVTGKLNFEFRDRTIIIKS
ncbi:FecR family protein [Chitinophaga sp. Cy-1792]|uniref:FecR family protein n=1 Tax=Chitinophaga sp. Cy-1792 TaxID=2608339 RepID=UPI001420FC53|nr:FecR family protein [Chitinophaga sp. Cy-1792]NIG52526.1 FecR family protein [Chitinophaga sp. Cy-1792]